MSRTARTLSLFALTAAASISWIAWRADAAETHQGAPPSLATPDHKLLEKYAGSWDAEVSMSMVPGQPAEKSAAKSTSRVGCGGLWLLTDFEGAMMGAPFAGHEVLGFDPSSRKYVVNWVDSMSASLSIGELDFDAKTKTLGGIVRGRDMTGKEVSWRQTDVWSGDDAHTYTMFQKGPDGNESVAISIAYKRHK